MAVLRGEQISVVDERTGKAVEGLVEAFPVGRAGVHLAAGARMDGQLVDGIGGEDGQNAGPFVGRGVADAGLDGDGQGRFFEDPVEEGGKMEWVSGSFGSHTSYLYPMTILKGDNSKMEYTGITFAGEGQELDTGMKLSVTGKNTSSVVSAKSISKSGGKSTFRSSVFVGKNAHGAKVSVDCASLMLDDISRSDTIPAMDIRTRHADVGHEAKIGQISDEAVFYLMSRGISEEDARTMIVSGFADNVSKELPLEYAVEMNNLIRLEMKGSIG